MDRIHYLPLIGKNAEPYLDAIGHLRIRVFRDYPYLYDGNFDYEKKYLERYFSSPNSFVVLCKLEDKIVGASTGIPLTDEQDEFRQPFLDAGIDPAKIFYFGESVLLSQWRGQGVGKEFFKYREAHAKSIPGITYTAFCSVIRPDNHPQRPANYVPLDEYWQRRGYKKAEGLVAQFRWKDVGEALEIPKQMQFWFKKIL